MKKQNIIIFTLAAICFTISIAGSFVSYGQEVISTAGQSHSNATVSICQTVGEAVIHSHSNGTQVDQGFHCYSPVITSINEVPGQQIEVSVYPNPFTQLVNVNSDEDLGAVEVYDLAGSMVPYQVIGSTDRSIQLDLSDLTSGQYLLRVQPRNSSEANTYKIIKQ